jgi:hypothetical protein
LLGFNIQDYSPAKLGADAGKVFREAFFGNGEPEPTIGQRFADASKPMPVKIVEAVKPPPAGSDLGNAADSYLKFLDTKRTSPDDFGASKIDWTLGASQIQTAAQTGIENGGSTLATHGGAFGTSAGSNIMSVAGPFGAAIARAISGAVGNINVNGPRAPGQNTRVAPDTGRSSVTPASSVMGPR